METKYFSLGADDNSSFVKVIRILFGIVCVGLAVFWIIFNLRSALADKSFWITVLFLAGFGMYQVWAGLGHSVKYIEIGDNKIVLKKNSLLPAREISHSEIGKIEEFPLNMIFFLRNGKKVILRFGTLYGDKIDPVKEELEKFSRRNNISFESITEEI